VLLSIIYAVFRLLMDLLVSRKPLAPGPPSSPFETAACRNEDEPQATAPAAGPFALGVACATLARLLAPSPGNTVSLDLCVRIFPREVASALGARHPAQECGVTPPGTPL
jgi:hypothetical protein